MSIFEFLFFFRRLDDASLDFKCKRCGLTIGMGHSHCPHCYGLSDAEMVQMLDEHVKNSHNEKLGYIFAATTVIIFFILIGVFYFSTV